MSGATTLSQNGNMTACTFRHGERHGNEVGVDRARGPSPVAVLTRSGAVRLRRFASSSHAKAKSSTSAALSFAMRVRNDLATSIGSVRLACFGGPNRQPKRALS